MKRVLIIGAWAGAAAVALLIAAGIVLRVMFPPERVMALAIPPIERALGRSVRVEGTGVSLFPLFGVSLRGVQIANSGRAEFSPEPFISIRRFMLSVKVLPLLSGRVEIGRILFDAPVILLEIDSKGSFNYDDLALLNGQAPQPDMPAKPSAPPMLPVPLSLETFEIRQGRVVFNDMKEKRRIELGHIEQRVAIAIDTELKDIVTTGTLAISRIAVQSREIPRPLTDLRVTLSHDVTLDMVRAIATVNELRVSLQKLSLVLSGSVSDINTTPRFDLRMRSDTLAIADIMAEVPPAMVPGIERVSATGALLLDMHVSSSADTPPGMLVSGRMRARGISIRHPDIPAPLSGGAVDLTFSDTELNVRTLTLKLGDNPISARVLLSDFSAPRIDGALQATVDLGALGAMAPLPEGMRMAGMLHADVNARGKVDPANPATLQLKGAIALRNVMLRTPELAEALRLNGSVQLTSQSIRADIGAQLGDAALKLEATLRDYLVLLMPALSTGASRSAVNFSLSSPYLDFDGLLAPSDAAGAGPEASATSPAAPLLLAAPLPGIDVRGTIRCAKTRLSGMDIGRLAVDINHKNDIARIDLNGSVYGGTLRLRLDADARDHRALKTGLTLQIDKVEANDIISSLNDGFTGTSALARALRNTDNLLYGRMTLKANLNASGASMPDLQRSLSGTLSASVAQGRIAACGLLREFAGVVERFYRIDDLVFSDLRGEVRLRDGDLLLDGLRIATAMGDVTVGGSVSGEGAYDVRIANRLSKNLSATLVQAQRTGKDAVQGLLKGTALAGVADQALDRVGIPVDRDGRVTVNLAVTGTLASPRVEARGFGPGAAPGETAQPQRAVATQLRDAVSTEVQQRREQATDAVKQEVKKVEQQAVRELEKALDSKDADELKKQAEDVKKRTGKALKKLF